MPDLNQAELKEITSLKQKTIDMFKQAQVMFNTCFDGLMKNDIPTLDQVLKDDTKLTEWYTNLTASTVEISKQKISDKNKERIVVLVDVISDIENIGDCCVSLVEQIEYKISEKALFSETAVQEYKDLHSKVEQILRDVAEVMKTGNRKVAENILKSDVALDELVDRYRANHIDRSAKGICDEWAKIRYLEMLNITKRVADYCREIVEKLIEK